MIERSGRILAVADGIATLRVELPPACAACEVRFVCRGGCPSRRIATQGDPRRPYDLECLLRQELYRSVRP
jgi:radical SAM protein with 4Fe4S-binding SPASM domain